MGDCDPGELGTGLKGQSPWGVALRVMGAPRKEL